MAATTQGACLLALLAVASASHSEVSATPVTKVLELLENMVTKAIKEKNDEETRMAAFTQWCADSKQAKEDAITEASERITFLKAEIQKYEAHINTLSTKILELDQDVTRWQSDQKSVSDIREKEAADYKAMLTDYEESLSALTDAIAVLKKQNFDRSQAGQALLQVSQLRLLPSSTKRALAAFLQGMQPNVVETDEQMPDDQLFHEAPAAAGYSFQSGGIIDMLEKLKDQFAKKKYDLEKEELNARHSYEQIMQALTDDVENAQHEIAKKTTERADTQQAKAQAEGELTQTIADRDEDQKYLKDATALCTQKAADFESRQKLRGEEIASIKKAIEIISSQTVAGAAEKHLPTFVQTRKRGPRKSLVQLRSVQQSPEQQRASEFLRERAQFAGSQLLSMMAQRVADDPFTKVKKMIKDLIVKLMEEGTAETEHKGWCDTELTTNKQTRDAKSEEVAKLNTEIEDLTAELAQLSQDIDDLNAQISNLDAEMATATSDRTESKEKNQATIQEAKDAQLALQQAITILKDYYAKSSEATALTQQAPAEDAPETFSEPYKGQLPESGSVIDFLEVILSDFARLETETSTAEDTEQDQFDTFMFESKKDKALKENAIKHKTEQTVDRESSLQTTKEELRVTQTQLDAAIAYYEKLKPTCVDSGISYEERVKRREEEIQSLKEALAILEGNDLPTVGSS